MGLMLWKMLEGVLSPWEDGLMAHIGWTGICINYRRLEFQGNWDSSLFDGEKIEMVQIPENPMVDKWDYCDNIEGGVMVFGCCVFLKFLGV